MMTFLLELKDNINKFYNKHNVYLVPALKFVVAFISFLLLNVQIGYMTVLKNPLIALAVSIICAFLPSGFTVVALSIFMLAHLYAISAEFAVISLCIVLVMYLLYFRFAPKQGYILIFTVILCWCKIPEAIPVAVALGAGLTSFIPVSFGVIIYYIIKTASAYETAITNSSVADSMQQISYIVESFFNNKSCLIFVIAFTVAIIITYIIKRLSVDNAWTYAIAVGTVSEFIILIVGSLALNAKINIVFMIIGIIIGAVAAYICKIVFFSVDYKRTEFVQYEDDEYYYYVKAVPKALVSESKKSVKKFTPNSKVVEEVKLEEVRQNKETKAYQQESQHQEIKPIPEGNLSQTEKAHTQDFSAKQNTAQEEPEAVPVERVAEEDFDFEKQLEESLKNL